MGSPTGIGEPTGELIGTGEPTCGPTGTGEPMGGLTNTGEPIGGPTGTGEPMCSPMGMGEPTYGSMDEPTDQFCSSCNQKKPLIDFGQFLTCNACRQRNTKANRVRKAKQKATIPPRPKATRE